MKKLILLLAAAAALYPYSSCKKKSIVPVKQADYFIVWQCGGMVIWPTAHQHATFYSISDTGLYCDTIHEYCFYPKAISDLHFNVPQPDSQYNKVKDLPHILPAELLIRSGTYGQPAIDGGSTFIRACVNGQMYSWVFETNLDDCSPEVKEFYFKVVTNL
jgi:hypothetical protein